MACARERLEGLTLVLSLLCPGAHRATEQDLSSGSLLSAVGDEQHGRQPRVHNICKNAGMIKCARVNKASCYWDWDEAARKFDCKPKTCNNMYSSDCQELPNQCRWAWDEEKGSGRCLNLVTGAEAVGFENPCRHLNVGACKLESQHCDWFGEECRPKTCVGLMGTHCQELKTQCVWKANTVTQEMECGDLPKDNPCKNLDSAHCMRNGALCAWDESHTTSEGNCRPKTCSGIKGSDCQELTRQCKWRWDNETQSGKCYNVPAARDDVDPCKYAEEDCRQNSEVCTWDWDPLPQAGICRPKSCHGLKGKDCVRMLGRWCYWDWNFETRVGKCLTIPENLVPERDNPCKDLKANQCTDKDDCVWDFNVTAMRNSCRPKTCAHIKLDHCRELTNQCNWLWRWRLNAGDCVDQPKDNPCKNLKGSECRSQGWQCAWDWNPQTSTGNCRPLTCAGIKRSDCAELSSQCTWKWDSRTVRNHCLDLTKVPTTSTMTIGDAKLKDNPCKNLKGSDCRNATISEHCAWDWDKQASTGNCRPKTCAGIKGSDCRELTTQCIYQWDQDTQTGECLDRPKVSSTTPAPEPELKDNVCKDLKPSLCRDKSEKCAWDWDKQTSTGNCRPRACAGIKGTDCRELTSQCGWRWDPISQSGECLDIPKAAAVTTTTAERGMADPCTNLGQPACKANDDVCNWDPLATSCKPKTCVGLRGSDCRGLPYHCVWQWEEDFHVGRCVDIIHPTTATTTSAGSRTAGFVSSLLLSLLGPFVL